MKIWDRSGLNVVKHVLCGFRKVVPNLKVIMRDFEVFAAVKVQVEARSYVL
jgi:hypothetical protein